MDISESDLLACGVPAESVKRTLDMLAANDKAHTQPSGVSKLEMERLKHELKADFDARLAEQKASADAQIRNMQYRYAIDTELLKLGIKNTKYMGRMLDQSRIKVSDDCTASGILEQIAEMEKEAPDVIAAFKGIKPAAPAEAEVVVPQVKHEKLVKGVKPAESNKPEPTVTKRAMTGAEAFKFLATRRARGEA